MEQGSTSTDANGMGLFAGDAWFDPIEAGIRGRVGGFIEELLEQELTAMLGGASPSGPRASRRATGTAVAGQLRPGRGRGAPRPHGCG